MSEQSQIIHKGTKKLDKNGKLRFSDNVRKKRTERQLRLIRETIEASVLCRTGLSASRELNISESAYHKRKKQYPEIQLGIDNWTKEIANETRRKVIIKSPMAADKMVELLDANSEMVQFNSAKDILDRAIPTVPTGSNIQVNVLNKIEKDIEDYGI